MTSVDAARDVAVLWTLDFDAELPCESDHDKNPKNPVCSGRAIYFYSCCVVNKVVCESAGEYVKWSINRGGECASCGAKTRECWSIRPI